MPAERGNLSYGVKGLNVRMYRRGVEVSKTYKEVFLDRLTAEERVFEYLCSSAFFISKGRRFMDNNERERDLNGFKFL